MNQPFNVMELDQKPEKSTGIAFGFLAGVLWGLPFLIPQVLADFSPLEVTLGRFFFFFVASCFSIRKAYTVFVQFTWLERFKVIALSASGFWLYSLILFWSIRRTGGVMASVVIGLLPLTIAFLTPFLNSKTQSKKNMRIHNRMSWKLGIAAIALGLFSLFAPFLFSNNADSPSKFPLGGLLGLLLCLVLWTLFSIGNSKFLTNRPQLSPRTFSGLIGIVSFLCLLPFFLSLNWLQFIEHRVQDHRLLTFILGAAALGVGSSWLANWFWNIGSQRLPAGILGPLMVSETLCGLLYSFAFENRGPRLNESISILLFLAGVFLTLMPLRSDNS